MIPMLFKRSLIILSLISLVACVVGKDVQRITPPDTVWIEKGRTTREQVLAKFEEPTSTGTHQGVGHVVLHRTATRYLYG